MNDVRDEIFCRIKDRKVSACIYTDMDGIISGVDGALAAAEEIGVEVMHMAAEGDAVYAGDLIMELSGSPKQICIAEDRIMAAMSKYSGVATAARRFVDASNGHFKVVGGAWKKMPGEIKDNLRRAAVTGGAMTHMIDKPMVYLDKNYVEMLGGIQKALLAVAGMKDRLKVIQIKGRYNADITREARTALASGADIICVDTGNIGDLKKVTSSLKPEIKKLQENSGYRNIYFAFGGGVSINDVPALIDANADFVDIGRSIVDAPLLDMRLEVTGVSDSQYAHDGYDLLDKSELVIEGILLNDTNLTSLAGVIAEELGISPEDVLVIDVRCGKVALDILQKRLDPKLFVAKEETILHRISSLSGVMLMPGARITSNGMLGWIAGNDEDTQALQQRIETSNYIAADIKKNIANRVIVFPTGAEVESGEIEDTNTPLIERKFRAAGFDVTRGRVLKDDMQLFTAGLHNAAEMGFGICITTGGVGAENKDYSVEAIEQLDPAAATPYIAKFIQGHGRHSKDGIRIGVGTYGATRFIALPGPNSEVSLCIDTVVKGVTSGWSNDLLAHRIACILREHLRNKIGESKIHK